MDFEVLRGLTKKEVNDIASTFLETVANLTGKPLIIYSDASNANDIFDASLFNKYPLWVANYEVDKPFTDIPYIGWQFTDKGQIPGIDGFVDRDTFSNDIIIDDKTPLKEPTNINSKVIYYRVKRGDNLTKIAREFNVSLSSIIANNNFKNPNLIYPNQIIKIIVPSSYSLSNKEIIYTVKRGDTLTKIAQEFNVSISSIVNLNHLINPNLIFVNQKLIIKLGNNEIIAYKVQKNDTLSSIALTYKTTINNLSQLNNFKNLNLIFPNQIIYIDMNNIYTKFP